MRKDSTQGVTALFGRRRFIESRLLRLRRVLFHSEVEPVVAVLKEEALADHAGFQRVLEKSKARGADRIRAIFEQPDMLTKDEVQRALHLEWSSLQEMISRREILALQGDSRGEDVRFPEWQIDKRKHNVRGGVKELFRELYDDAWSVYRFLVMPCPELDGAPPKDVMWKRKDGVKLVQNIAHNIGRN